MKLFAFAVPACALVATIAFYAFGINVAAVPAPPGSVTYTDRNGSVLGTLLGAASSHAVAVPLRSVSPEFLNAIVAAEDARFWRHGAIDVFALARAARELRDLRRGAQRRLDDRDAARAADRRRRRRGQDSKQARADRAWRSASPSRRASPPSSRPTSTAFRWAATSTASRRPRARTSANPRATSIWRRRRCWPRSPTIRRGFPKRTIGPRCGLGSASSCSGWSRSARSTVRAPIARSRRRCAFGVTTTASPTRRTRSSSSRARTRAKPAASARPST